jgi:hypothetical protein
MVEKKMLSVEAIESQAVLELPERELMLVTVVIGNLLSGNTVEIDVRNVQVAAQICAAVLSSGVLTCDFEATN